VIRFDGVRSIALNGANIGSSVDEFNITGEAGNYKVELIANVGLDGTFACDTFHEVVVEPYDHRQVRMTYLDVAQES